jgi:hypothetical protein
MAALQQLPRRVIDPLEVDQELLDLHFEPCDPIVQFDHDAHRA